ncbi:MAG: hypothetical protein IJW73_06930 [Candidatus Gastranaerophilales bacterium]|nr:hypothetical protein [Candidatus Gastranaerophilales bacterium]
MVQSTNMLNPYPQQGGANAVAINIYNPQAYGAPATQQQVPPYAYTNSLYNMPQVSAYPQMAAQPMAYPQYIPTGVVNNAPMLINEPQLTAPAPQAMPQSVIVPEVAAAPVQQEVVQAPAQEVAQAPVQQAPAPVQQAPAPVQQAPAPVEIVEPQQQVQVIDIDGLVNNLKSADVNLKGETINQIATYAQEAPEVALQVVSEPVMQGLVDIINEDTTGLQGPTPEQIAVAEKIAKGAQLTPEEDALAEQLSPRDAANKNRIFALYTLAMIQKLQRDELNQYIEAQKANGQEAIAPLNVQDLVGYNDVVNVIKNDARPEVKVAAIQALQHVVEPQDKATIEAVLADAQNSQDEAVKTAAAEAMAKFQA